MAAGLRANLRLVTRLFAILCLIPASLVQAVLLACVNAFSPRSRRRLQPPMMRLWFRLLARIWGIEVEVRGRPATAPVLVASNHRSWLDIIVYGATLSGTFISKAEIDRWLLIGYLSRHGGRTLYISRGEMRSFKSLGGNLIGRLREGDRVIFFPEGTVSGDCPLRRFRPRLFEAAIAADCPVQPVALAYVDGDGAAAAPMRLDDKFPFHALRMLRCERTVARLEFLSPLMPGGKPAKELAGRAQAAVAAVLTHGELPSPGEFAGTLGGLDRGCGRDK
ncbi:MAG: lysophospholipid acyltransferase family protein [Gammaproteobacteria bacterium]